MKLKLFIPLLALSAGLLVSCEKKETQSIDSIIDSILQKAQGLEENTYVVQSNDGDTHTFTFTREESYWYIGRSSIDRSKQAIKVYLTDEDPQQSTMGWGVFELPLETANKIITVNQEFYQRYSWSYSKFGTFRTGKEITVHMGPEGNVKLDGNSKIWLKEKTGSKAYSGQYQLFFEFVFEAETWDTESRTYIPDGEYTIYGNAIVDEYFPTLDYFSIQPSTDWVQVGNTAKVDLNWTDGADLDPSKIKLVGQVKGYGSIDSDEGYFSWDANTQTLTSLKSSDNTDVYLKFAYEGTDLTTTCSIATGPGWEYTSFTLYPSRLVMDKYDALYINISRYAPTNVTWDWDALEIDPETDPDEAFYYDKYTHKLYNFSAEAGKTYNLRLRVKSNHSVSAPLEVFVVDGLD